MKKAKFFIAAIRALLGLSIMLVATTLLLLALVVGGDVLATAFHKSLRERLNFDV